MNLQKFSSGVLRWTQPPGGDFVTTTKNIFYNEIIQVRGRNNNFVVCQVITRDKEKQAMLEQVILAMVKWVITVASLRMKKMLKMLDLLT